MFSELLKDRKFALVAFVFSLIFSFLAGYVTFRYLQIEMGKSPMEVGNFSGFEVICERGCD